MKHSDSLTPGEHSDIVLVGGGFGAMNAALFLDRQLARGLKAEITLINRNNFSCLHRFSPRSPLPLVEARHAVNPIRRMLSRVRFIEGTVHACVWKGDSVGSKRPLIRLVFGYRVS